MKNSKKITFPTYITLVRLIGAPVLVPFFIVHYVPYNYVIINLLIAILFLLFGFTDYLDGFFARKYAQETQIGASLDHLADKFLVFSAFIALLAIHKISYVWVFLLLSREFYMMGLREFAVTQNIQVKVSLSAKLKTVFHICFITWIIINPMQNQSSFYWNGIEQLLLVVSLLLSLGSAFGYSMMVHNHLKSR